jgi:hypothetical protein
MIRRFLVPVAAAWLFLHVSVAAGTSVLLIKGGVGDGHTVAAPVAVGGGVQRLMQIADEMNQVPERVAFQRLIRRRRQDPVLRDNRVDDAVAARTGGA